MFKIQTYLGMMDSLLVDLKKPIEGISRYFAKTFGFLSEQTPWSIEKIKKKAKNLVYSYPDDLEETLAAELIHFAAFFRTVFLYAPTPAVCNQENREKKFRTTPWTYLTNRRNAAATILPTLIRHCLPVMNYVDDEEQQFYAICFTYFVL